MLAFILMNAKWFCLLITLLPIRETLHLACCAARPSFQRLKYAYVERVRKVDDDLGACEKVAGLFKATKE